MENYIRIVLVAVLLSIISLTGCKKSKEETTLAFLYPSKMTERFNRESQYFKEYCEKKGVKVIIKTANNDESLQIELANQLIDQEVDGLVIIAANINTAAVIVRNAHSEDIPVMAYNRMIKNSEVDFFVGSSNDIIGKLMVEGVLKEKPTGNYVILGGDKFDKNGLDLQKSVLKYLNPHVKNGSVKIIYETFIERWDPNIAAFEMDKVISLYGKDIDAVIAGYDGMSSAVIEVLKTRGLEGNVVVTGQDAELKSCKDVIAGNQLLTVYHPLKMIAEKGAEIAIEMAKGKDLEDLANSSEFNGLVEVPTHRVNSLGVTKDNIDKVLVESGFLTKEQLYN